MADEGMGELLPVVGELAVIRHGELRPGDVLVLSCLNGLGETAYRRLGAAAAELGLTVLVLEGGVGIEAILHRDGQE